MGDVELEAAAALYSGAALERLKPVALVDRLVELWMRGGLPSGATSSASRALDRYWLHRDGHISQDERREIYARAFDHRFDDRWAALLAALTQAEPGEQAGEQAEALREQLGACVTEDIIELTPRIHAQLVDALEVLEDPEVLLAYGARDIWELIDTLARLELGTVPEVSRVRTMAASGSAIIAWLTDEKSIVTDEVVDAAQTWLETAAAPPEG